MKTEKLELTASCHFEVTRYEGYPTDVSLEYVEHACDHWSSDARTSVTINEEDARKIVAFLTAAFGPNVRANRPSGAEQE